MPATKDPKTAPGEQNIAVRLQPGPKSQLDLHAMALKTTTTALARKIVLEWIEAQPILEITASNGTKKKSR